MPALAAIALDGPKAVGKTATASRRATTVYRLDDEAQRSIAEADLNRILAAPKPILIDEWQHVPPVWDNVRRAVDDGASPGSFLLAGSASPEGGGTHSGAGRIVRLRMRPLTLAERLPTESPVSLAGLLSGTRPSIAGHTNFTLADYTEEILRSGFPGLRGLSGRPLRLQLDSYLQRVVDRDFRDLGHTPRNPNGLRRWMSAYAAATATVATFERIRAASTLKRETAPARSTVLPYREILQRLFLLDEVPGWQPSRNQLSQLALPPSIISLTPRSRHGCSTPPLKTFSLVTLSVRTYAQASEARVCHFRTRGGRHEVDLIVERHDGRITAIEVTLGASAKSDSVHHLNWLQQQIGDDLLERVVLTTGTDAYRRADGICVIPAALLGP